MQRTAVATSAVVVPGENIQFVLYTRGNGNEYQSEWF